MKILKEGKIPEKSKENIKEIYRVNCENCGCEFECNKGEVEIVEETYEEMSMLAFGAGRNIISEKVTRIKCPCCNTDIKLNSKITNIEWRPWSKD